MAIATAVHRRLRYVGGGCRHAVLLQATRPAYPNHDGGAEDAAYAFVDSAFAHLQVWFEGWQLPSLCPSPHDLEQSEGLDVDEPVEGLGFRWVEVAGEPTYLLTDVELTATCATPERRETASADHDQVERPVGIRSVAGDGVDPHGVGGPR